MLRHSHIWTVAALTFCVVCWGSAAVISNQDWKATEASQIYMAKAAARLMERQAVIAMQSAMRALDQAERLAREALDTGEADKRDLNWRLKDLVFANSAISTLYVVGIDGATVLTGMDSNPNPLGASPGTGATLLARHREVGPGILIGPTTRGIYSGIPRFTVSRAWTDRDGAFHGVLVAGVRIEYFGEVSSVVAGGSNMRVTLRSAAGDILARLPDTESETSFQVSVAQRRDLAGLMTVVVERSITDEIQAWRARTAFNVITAFLLCAGFLLLWHRAVLIALAEQRARQALHSANQNLESRVAHRTEHHRQLIKELTHRTKNILAVVQSVARHTAGQCADFASFERSFSGRLTAIAASHDALVKNHWHGAMLHEVIEAQLKPFVGTDVHQIVLSGEPVMLKPKATEVLSLALHELATNAAKYGALSSPEGHVEVRWQVEAEDEPKLIVEWREHGGPAVTPPTRVGFGQVVCKTMVERSIGGRATLRHEPSGVVWAYATEAGRALAA